MLAQRESQGDQYKIISYASRPLTPVERRYSQTDIEGLSLVWRIEHFRLFLIGSEFGIITDHKTLESIFDNPKSKSLARIERRIMRLQPFDFKVIYKKGIGLYEPTSCRQTDRNHRRRRDCRSLRQFYC